MRQRLLWILLAGLAAGFVVLAVRHGAGTVGPLSVGDFGSLVYKIVLLVFLGSAVLILFRERLAQALLAAVLWVALALVLVVGYTYRFELRDVADRVMAEVVPGHVIMRGPPSKWRGR